MYYVKIPLSEAYATTITASLHGRMGDVRDDKRRKKGEERISTQSEKEKEKGWGNEKKIL